MKHFENNKHDCRGTVIEIKEETIVMKWDCGEITEEKKPKLN